MMEVNLKVPRNIVDVAKTMREMTRLGIGYHFDDDAIDCLATPYEGRHEAPPLTVKQAIRVQKIVDTMRAICDSKGIDIFDMLAQAEIEVESPWAMSWDVPNNVKEVYQCSR